MIRFSREDGDCSSDRVLNRFDEGDDRRVNDDTNSSTPKCQATTQELYDELQQEQKDRGQKSTDSINSDENNKSKRNPYCSRCRNHGKSAQVKGHKRHCEYRECQCEGCILVEFRQRISANQIKRRRYQKQDQECGRCVEISPPVLTKTPNTELIAKLLIGPSKSSDITIAPSLQNPLSATLPIQSNLQAQAPQSTIEQQCSSISSPLQQQPKSLNQNGQISNRVSSDCLNNHLTGHSSLHHKLNEQRGLGDRLGSSDESKLNNLFSSVFQLPESILSRPTDSGMSTTDTHIRQAQSNWFDQSREKSNSNTIGRELYIGVKDQLSLAEELYSSFGPLALFAWLKTEQFDLNKIGKMIDLCRPLYQELIELRARYASQNDNAYGNLAVESRGVRNSETNANFSANPNNSNADVNVCSSSGNSSRRSSSNSNIEERIENEDNNYLGKNRSTYNAFSLDSDSAQYQMGGSGSCPGPTTTSLSSSISHDKVSKPPSSDVTLTALRSHDSLCLTQPFQAGSVYSLASPYMASARANFDPQTSTQSHEQLFWPNFKFMQNTGSSSASSASDQLLHPHQLLPHFMHHQHFLAQQAAAHQHHHQHRQLQHQLSSTAAAVAAAAAATAANASKSSPSGGHLAQRCTLGSESNGHHAIS